MSCGRRFPIQGAWLDRGRNVEGSSMDWHEAEAVYEDYRYLYGGQQSLERLAERGGWGPGEAAYIRQEAERKRRRGGPGHG